MLSPGSGNTVIKSAISRRMFLITAAKASIVGLVGRLISLQINQATKYKSLSDKIDLENGSWHLKRAIKDFLIRKLLQANLFIKFLGQENAKDLDNLFVRLKAILNITDKALLKKNY